MSASNDALASDGIILKVQDLITSKKDVNLTIEQIANIFSQECKNKLKLERENQIYLQYGLTEEEFKEKSNKLSELIVKDILDRLHEFKYDFEVEFLLVGIDSNPFVPHLYTITEMGDIQNSDHMGFATVGSGKYLAFPEMTKYAYHPNSSLSESIMRVYWSKKIAERVGGVGKETDLVVLHTAPESEVMLWIAESKHKELLDKKLEDIHKFEFNTSVETLKELTDTVFNLKQELKTLPEKPQ